MALLKCTGCSTKFYGSVCPSCGGSGVATTDTKAIAGTMGCLAFVGVIAVFGFLLFRSVSNSPPAAPRPTDDAELFISQHGPPDKQDSTDYDVPRPPIPSRFLVYEAEHVRVLYIPDAKVGEPPPYKWKLVGFQDDRDNRVLQPAEAVERLKGRRRQ